MFGKFSSLDEMMLKGLMVAEAFYPFVDNGATPPSNTGGQLEVRQPARIAVYDDAAAAPRVVVVEPKDIRSYLEEITATVTKLAQEQGGRIPFTVIREVVENLIHAYFIEPTVSILDGGNTIRFSDQGPGIQDKDRALEYGTTSATTEMKRYIRGVGSGLPYAQQWLEDKGGSLTVDDNIHRGTVVTVSLVPQDTTPEQPLFESRQNLSQGGALQGTWPPQSSQVAQEAPQPWANQPGAMPYMMPQSQPQPYSYGQQPYQQQAYPPAGVTTGWQQPGYQPWPPQAYGQPMYQQPQPAMPNVSERGAFALQYLMGHESVGPRDLNALQPLSESTWSRELSQLEAQGLISKQGGQKRRLTPLGRQFLGLG